MIVYKVNYLSKRKLKKFKKDYINLYEDDLKDEINERLLLGFTNNNDVINQIYCYLEIIPDNINPYKEFINIIKKYFNNRNSILEVGAGYIPIVAKYLENQCDMTIMDPKILFQNYAKANIKKESFTLNTNLNKYDLIIGYNPCEATQNIIINAIKHKKNFIIATCGCCYLPLNYKERTKENWHRYLIKKACLLGEDDYDIIIDYFDEQFHINNPIIVGKLKK